VQNLVDCCVLISLITSFYFPSEDSFIFFIINKIYSYANAKGNQSDQTLIGLEPFTSIEDDDASDGDHAVHYSNPKVTGNYVEVPLIEAEQFFGRTIESSSTHTSSDAPSDKSQEQLSETLPGGSGTLSEKKKSYKENHKVRDLEIPQNIRPSDSKFGLLSVIQTYQPLHACQHPSLRAMLVASFMDPRFKFGPGFSDYDKQYIWDVIRRMMTIVALAEHAEQEPIQGDQEQHLQPQRQLVPRGDARVLQIAPEIRSEKKNNSP
jgi:hypothetical protein